MKDVDLFQQIVKNDFWNKVWQLTSSSLSLQTINWPKKKSDLP